MLELFRTVRAPIKRRSASSSGKRRERLPWPSDRDFRILSLDGGGIRGILPLAVLAGLEETYLGGKSVASCFDLVAGTSTGGIIALGLGAGKTAREILDVYVDRGGAVFPPLGRVRRLISGAAHALVNRCDQAKLEALTRSVLGDQHLWESGLRLCIPAAETRHFEPFIFKTPHHPDYRLDWRESMVHAALTTAAAPTYFKPVRRGDGLELIDGGVWANNPVMIGVADTLSCFDIRPQQLRVLSLGCVMDEFVMSSARRALGGQLFWASSIMFESMHMQSHNVVGQAKLIAGHDRVVRLDAPPINPRLDLADWARCREVLPGAAHALLTEFGPAVAQDFLRDLASPYKPLYTPENPPLVAVPSAK